MKITQCDKILMIMLKNEWKVWWDARDFQQSGDFFIGYEATARISDLVKKYPDLFLIGKEGRFRTISINWENKDEVNNAKNYISTLY